MKYIIFITVATILIIGNAFKISAQNWIPTKEFNMWYFGKNAAIDFNSGSPVVLTNSAMYEYEGTSTICDNNGNLLFYTNGIDVWNKNNILMTNGTGLGGGSNCGAYSFGNSGTQAAVIAKQPGSNTLYYIFTKDQNAVTCYSPLWGLRYSVVDMSLSAGLGSVTIKNTLLLSGTPSERLTAVKNSNCVDYWIIHFKVPNTFYAYPFTSIGVGIPVISTLGITENVQIGELKASPDRVNLALASYGGNTWKFNFNNTSGVVSSPLNLGNFGSYGIEFSSDNSKLYAGVNDNLYQFDLCAGSSTAIVNSKTIIGNTGTWIGDIQIGPDEKLYVAHMASYNPGDPYLGVINNPNTSGVGCSYINNGLFLSGRGSQFGLPNIIDYYPKYNNFTVASSNCIGNFSFPLSCTTNSTIQWDFGDPSSGALNSSTLQNPSHTYAGNGSYNTTLIVTTFCYSDTLKQTVNISNCSSSPVVTVTGNSVCLGSCAMLSSTGTGGISPYTYFWSNGATAQNINPCPVIPTTYTVTIKDAGGNTSSSTTVVTVNPAVTVTTNPTGITCKGNTDGSASVNPGNGTLPYTYNWNNGQNTQTITGLTAGNYTVTITDSKGCTSSTTVSIISPLAISAQFTKGTVSCISCGCKEWIMVTATGGSGPFSYTWPDGSINRYKNQLCPGTYTVNIKDNNGCSVIVNLNAP